MATQKKTFSKWIQLLILVVFVGGLIAYALSNKTSVTQVTEKSSESTTKQTEPTEQTISNTKSPESASGGIANTSVTIKPEKAPTSEPKIAANIYKNGTFSSAGIYRSPAGEESIHVSLTLKDDVVTDVKVVANATAPFSKNWQAKFIAGVKPVVVGKKIADLHVTTVSGSSLTPQGFNDAVAKIAAQAKT